VIIAIAISTLLWPVSSIRLLRSEIMVSVGAFQQGVDRTMRIYESMARVEQRRRNDDAVKRDAVTAPVEEQKESIASAEATDGGTADPAPQAGQIEVQINEEDERQPHPQPLNSIQPLSLCH